MNRIYGLVPALLAGFVLLLAQPGPTVLAGDEPRPPPEARTAGTLGPQVMRAISEIQELMSPEDPEDEPDLASAKVALDELRERRWERMNDFEKSTLLNFYTNYYLSTEDFQGALRTFEEMLTIEDLREDTRRRTHRSLGQLYAAEEEWQRSIDNYNAWRELSLEEDEIVFKGLSYAHYQLESMLPARDFWLDYMILTMTNGAELGRDDYTYLNGVYFTLESFEEALELTKTMIVKFDDPTDWQNLSAIYASLDQEDERVRSLNLAYLRGGILDDDSRYLNLGQSLAGMEIPLSGRKILDHGFENGFIPDDLDNNVILAQMSMLGAEYDDALEPAIKSAELDTTGNSHDTLGYLYYVLYQYENSVEAFRTALERGGLDDRADTLLFLARALVELDEFDEALEAAADSAEAGGEQQQQAARNYRDFIRATRDRFNVLADRRADAIDFYETYPSLID